MDCSERVAIAVGHERVIAGIRIDSLAQRLMLEEATVHEYRHRGHTVMPEVGLMSMEPQRYHCGTCDWRPSRDLAEPAKDWFAKRSFLTEGSDA
jgi:hypothetical protein